jgi:hypothetical protein
MDDALKPGLLIAAGAGLAAGLALRLAGLPGWSPAALAAGTLIVLAALLVQVARGIARGDFALDIVAALAMAGALLLGEVLAGAVVALMFAGGQALEARAGARARREMTALLARQPRIALRQSGERLEEIPIGGHRPRRPPPGPAGGGAAGRRRARRPRHAGRGRPDRRAPAGLPQGRCRRPQRHHQCRRQRGAGRQPPRQRQQLRCHPAPGRGRRRRQAAHGAPRRKLVGRLPAGDAGAVRWRLARHRRPAPRPRRAGRRHPLPVAAGRARGAGGRAEPRGARRRHDQVRRGAGDAGAGSPSWSSTRPAP